MGGASRFLMLLSTSFPLLHPRPSSSSFLCLTRRSLCLSSSHHHHQIYHSIPCPLRPKKPKTQNHHPSIFKSQLHSQSPANSVPFESKGSVSSNLVWPEWARLVENLSDGGYFGRGSVGRGEDDEVVGMEEMPEEFVTAAGACLAFARDRPDALRLLDKKNIEVIVNGRSPSLFKNGASSARRMRLFLSGDESSVLKFERAETVDVMRYVLSYAYDSLNISDGIKQSEADLVEASVRNVLAEFVNMGGTVQSSTFTASTPKQHPVNHEQLSRPPVQNIEMKRGDWICPKCSFMNFARNRRCLECEEARPKSQLTGREWECPQCDFYNNGRNTSCLRCDCKRPVDIPSGTPYGENSSIDKILSGSKTVKSELGQRLATNDEKAERWFSKVSQLGDKTDMSRATADDDFPEIRSTRKTPLERRLVNSQSGVSNGIGSNKSSESSISESLDRILGRTSTPQSASKTDPGHVPFVPLPPDMFGKPQNTNNEVQHVQDGSKNSNESSNASDRWLKKVAELDNVTDVANAIPEEDFPDIMPMRKGENRFVVSKKKDRSLTSPQYKRRLAMEQANKSDFVPFVPFPPGYFAKKDKQPDSAPSPTGETVAENSAPPKNVQVESRNSSQINNTPYSGNNLNESKESWNSGISQTSNTSNDTGTNWDSAKLERGKSQSSNQSWNSGISPVSNDSNITSTTWGSKLERKEAQNSGQSWNGGISQTSNTSNDTGTNWDSAKLERGKSRSSNQSWNSGISQMSSDPNSTSTTWGSKFERQEAQNSGQSWNGGTSQTSNDSNTTSTRGSSNLGGEKSQSSSQSWNKGFTGKSLEGSAVTEPDPLDMSEEAKAVRWFRRAAQIKNISELSEIPDEDFPEIMPMRKGVNRFVVSKRKTPLERRLTSPQYRRNLPIVSSEPEKDSN